jgi:hypothetical protein
MSGRCADIFERYIVDKSFPFWNEGICYDIRRRTQGIG